MPRIGLGIGITRNHGRGRAVEFDLRDDFLTSEGAPLSSPRSCEPGPGSLNIVDTGNLLSILNGELKVNGRTVNYTDPVLLSGAFNRAAGLTAFFNMYAPNDNNTIFGFNANSGGGAATYEEIFFILATLKIYIRSSTNIKSFVLDTDFNFGIVLRASGCFYLINGKIEYIVNDKNNSPLYLWFGANVQNIHYFDFARVFELGAPWDSDFGIVTQRLAGARSPGDTFSHEADCLIELTVDTRPVSDLIILQFRIQDSDNLWKITVNSAGNITLIERVGAGDTTRGSSAGAVSNGDRIVLILDDNIIKIFIDDNLGVTYSSAINFKTETNGELNSEGTGGAVSDLVSWPRVLSGAALAELTRFIHP